MDKIKKYLKENIVPHATKFSEHPYVRAINFSLGSITPILLFGGLLLILMSPPGKSSGFFSFWHEIVSNKYQGLEFLFQMTMGVLSVFITTATAYQLSVLYREQDSRFDPYSSAIIAAVIFFLLSANGQFIMNINLEYLSSRGYFLALIVGILTVEVNRILLKYNIQFKMPKSIPPAVASSFSALIPLFTNILVFFALNYLINGLFSMGMAELVYQIGRKLAHYADTAIFVMAVMLFSQLMWVVGVHGGSITGVITSVFYKHNIIANGVSMVKDGSLPYIMTGPLSVYLVVMGGAGATLGLNILMKKSQTEHLQKVAKEGMMSSLFGINEPILYGTPVVGNPVFDIPFIITPLINIAIVYFVFTKNLVQRAYISLPWASPSILGLPIATMDLNAVWLVVIVLLVDMLVYYPFLKKYDQKLLEKGEI